VVDTKVSFPKLELIVVGSALWTTASYTEGELVWKTEAAVQGFVKQAMFEFVAMSGLKLDCHDEVALMTLRPDFWLVTKNGGPVGVIEVKKPNKEGSIMEADVLHGQMFDYLLLLREGLGIKLPFGLATTYEKWRAYWLPLGSTPTKRVVHGSKVYHRGDLALQHMVCGLLKKMDSSQREIVDPFNLSPQRAYITLSEVSWSWARLSNGTQLNLSQLPRKDCKQLHLLKHLGKGSFGTAALACSANGNCCVLKTGNTKNTTRNKNLLQDEEKALVGECEAWRAVYNVGRVQLFRSRATLVMPFIEICDVLDDDVREAAEFFAKRGYKHEDLRKRHVGKKGSKVMFIDLGRVSKLAESTTETRKEAVDAMMKQYHGKTEQKEPLTGALTSLSLATSE
jgi:hypothetical protein